MKKFLILALALVSLSACTVVGPTERAVRYNFGKVDDEVLTAGTHLWIPYFAGTKTLSVNVHAIELQTSSGTKDQQEVTTKVVVNLQLDPSKVVDIVKTYGDEEAVISQVIPQIQEAVNANVSKFSAEEILTKREQLKEAIDHVIKDRAAKYSVIVHDISIKDLQYSPEYARAIEQKQIAEQKSKQAEYDAVKASKEADGAINTARGCISATFGESTKQEVKPVSNEKIRVMVIDTGIASLPETKDYLATTNSAADLDDKNGHGTHIAGIILYGRDMNDPVCSQVELHSCKFYGQSAPHTTENCLKAAKNLKMDVVNFSGGGREKDEAEDAAVKDYPGWLIVAAGNYETNDKGEVTKPAWDISKEFYYPASLNLPNMRVIGNGTSESSRNSSSNFGLFGMIWRNGEGVWSLDPKGGKRRMSGTSQATAIYTHELLKDKCQRLRSAK